MSNQDPRIDAYIAKTADFARPILSHLRTLVHKACPAVTETIKWSMPYFEYNGSILCSFAAFKSHCAFIFWRGAEMNDPDNIFHVRGESAMGQLGKIESKKDLPADKIFIKYLKAAAQLNDSGVKAPAKAKTTAKKELEIPDWFTTALKKNKKALATFNAFSYTNKKEYVDWLTDAKTQTTRDTRLASALEWMAEGKIRNWKYTK